jgi:hypothetical protein
MKVCALWTLNHTLSHFVRLEIVLVVQVVLLEVPA